MLRFPNTMRKVSVARARRGTLGVSLHNVEVTHYLSSVGIHGVEAYTRRATAGARYGG